MESLQFQWHVFALIISLFYKVIFDIQQNKKLNLIMNTQGYKSKICFCATWASQPPSGSVVYIKPMLFSQFSTDISDINVSKYRNADC